MGGNFFRRFLLPFLVLSGCAVPAVGPDGGTGTAGGTQFAISPGEPIFPHDVGWREPDQHGIYALNFGRAACRQCHGPNFEGGAGPSCFNCHEVFPHEAQNLATGDWILDHKLKIRENGTTASCATQCHGPDLRGGLSGVNCDKCHTQYPHPADWINGHRPVAWGILKPLAVGDHDVLPGRPLPVPNCTDTCHQSNDSPSVPCATCHAGNRHPANWRDLDQHPKKYTEQLPAHENTTCMVCHGGDYAGGSAPLSCADCHNGMFSHRPDWKEHFNHGQRYRDMKAVNNVDCFECHEDPFPFYRDYNGVAQAPVPPPLCQQCHAAFPHVEYEHVTLGGRTIRYPWSNSRAHVTLITNDRDLLPRGNQGLDDPVLVGSLRQTCTGPNGGCHAGGRGSSEKGAKVRAACTTVCHTQNTPTPW